MRKSRSESILPRLKILYILVLSQYSLLANHVTDRSCRCNSASIIWPMCIIFAVCECYFTAFYIIVWFFLHKVRCIFYDKSFLFVDDKSRICSWWFTFMNFSYCVIHNNKKGGTIRNLFCSVVPPSTMSINKYEQFTPDGRELSVTYSHGLLFGGFQNRE